MASASTGFLLKSIVLLSLVLILMGSSMFFGKQLGKDVMAFTENKIHENYGDVDSVGSDENRDLVYHGERTSFNQDTPFSGGKFSGQWADPVVSEVSVVNEENAVVDITLLDNPDAASEAPEKQPEETETPKEESTEKPKEKGGGSIFELGKSQVFRIQVGTFDSNENAESVRRRLKQAGYNASVSTYTDNEIIRYRVQVGNFSSREEADATAEQLRALNFDAWVFQVK